MIAQRLFFRDGSQLDLGDSENAFLTTTAEILGFTNPILLPPLATRQELRESSQSCPGGAEVCDDLGNSMSVETNSSSICAYVAERDAPGTRLDMNVYLVDLPGFDADMVQDSPVFQRFWEDVDEILAGADLEVGEVRYREFEPEIAEAYGVVRRTSDVQALARATELPGETLDEQLSINIFMTRGFSFQGGGAIGISLGIPGPAGLHGSSASGVALTAEFLGRAFTRGGSRVDGNKYTAQILVHEIGHFLGLFHTTEQDQLNTDPIEDTPSCPRNFNFPNQCPDRQNLMFPLAGVGNVTISEGQSFVMQANPLTAP